MYDQNVLVLAEMKVYAKILVRQMAFEAKKFFLSFAMSKIIMKCSCVHEMSNLCTKCLQHIVKLRYGIGTSALPHSQSKHRRAETCLHLGGETAVLIFYYTLKFYHALQCWCGAGYRVYVNYYKSYLYAPNVVTFMQTL